MGLQRSSLSASFQAFGLPEMFAAHKTPSSMYLGARSLLHLDLLIAPTNCQPQESMTAYVYINLEKSPTA